ncbi:DNA repair protein rad50 [Entomortierella beljakovae]|nr:DNA repair protein rad50 [Entomortierella beljakovae]
MDTALPIPRFSPLIDVTEAITSVLTDTINLDTTPGIPIKNGPVVSNPFKNRPTAFDDPIRNILISRLEKYKSLERAADRATLLETAFKLKLVLTQNELGTRIPDLRDAMFQCLDLLLRCSELDLLDHTTPLNCIEEVLELQTVECSEHIYNYLESRVDRLTVHMVAGKGKGLTLLRLCNELLRRLSKAKNTVFCGRILMLLASVFPLTERSGVNLRGEFNTENVTLIESEDTTIVPEITSTPQQSQKETDEQVPSSEAMDVDEVKEVKDQTGDNQGNIAKDEEAFYTEFWGLQGFFCSPTKLFSVPENMAKLKTGIDHALDKFEAIEAAEKKARGQREDTSETTSDSKPANDNDDSVTKSSSSGSAKRKFSQSKDKIAEPSIYFPKFLTSSKLLQLEIADPYFRKHILVQFLIIIQYLENHNVAVKEAYAKIATPNKSFQPHWILEEKDQEWVSSVKPRIHKQLKATGVESGDVGFMNTVNAVLSHEESWIQWKVESCQSFERLPVTESDLEETQAKRQKLSQGLAPFKQKLGCATLSDLWSEVEEEVSGFGRNKPPRTLDDYIWATRRSRAINKSNLSDQEQQELEQARLWKGLRLGAEQYMHLYGKLVADSSYSFTSLENDVKEDKRREAEIKANGGKVPPPKVVEPPPKTTEEAKPEGSGNSSTTEESKEALGESMDVSKDGVDSGSAEIMEVDAESSKKVAEGEESVPSNSIDEDDNSYNSDKDMAAGSADPNTSEEISEENQVPILLIRGVRSFEADSGEAATITFYSPLTLITGHNGSGKTTIIECLRYATTGEMPPGSKGGAFVNDPRITDSPSVKAQVRLRFKNVNNQIMSITRSLAVTVKKNSFSQRTLENVLAVVDPQTGELATVSAKCAELDADVPDHLGVSRAILDNVIFCHQEDSSWPLSEPASLKKKFDDIFASTKLFMTMNWNSSNNATIVVSQVRDLLSKNIQSIESDQQKVEELDRDIAKCGDEISQLMEMTKEIQAMEATLSAISHEHRATLANIHELEGTFTPYSESDSVLSEMLFKHEFSLKTADQEKSKQERTKQQALSSIANLETSANSNQQSIGQLKAQLDSVKKKQIDRDQLICDISQQYSYNGFESKPFVNSDVTRFISALEEHLKQKTDELEKIKAANKLKEQEIRSQISSLKAKDDMSLSLKTKMRSSIQAAKSKLSQQKDQMLQYQSAEKNIQSTEKLLQEQEEALALIKSGDPNHATLESRRRSTMADIEAFENELSNLSDRSAAQVKNAGIQAKLAMLKDACNQKKTEIQNILDTNRDGFQSVIKETLQPESLESKLTPLIEMRGVAAQASKDVLARQKNEVAGYKVRIEEANIQLQRHEATLKECERKIKVACGDEDLAELLEKNEVAAAELREQVQDVKTMSTMYGRFIALAEKKHACPLCSRGFEPALETQFTTKLRRLMEKVENDDEQELSELDERIAVLRPLKSVSDTATKLESDDIPELKSMISELNEKLHAANKTLDSAETEAFNLATELESLKELGNIAKSITQLSKEVVRDNTQIGELETQLLITGSTQSAEELQAEYAAMQQKVRSSRQDLNNVQQQINQMLEEIQNKEQIVQSLKDKRSRLQSDHQRQYQLAEQITETEASVQNLMAELQQHEAEDKSTAPELARLHESLKKVTFEAQSTESGIQETASELQTKRDRIRMFIDDIERLDSRQTMRQLSKLEADNEGFFEEIQQHKDTLNTAEKSMQGLQQQFAEFKNLQRNIDDNLRHRRYMAKAKELDTKINELKSKMDGKGKDTYSSQLNRLSKRQSNLTSERAGIKGELRQLQDQKRQYEDELSGEYKDVVQKYHDSLIGYKTTELALQDLDKYSKALKSAIVEYHSMKMQEINKSIKELWTNTYRGTDIDTIEIRSDQEGLRANQSYNYRVVMLQNGRALDVRGRCSAGQKVLASIIIRLALAESFSLNCGILALDEPTTNLDEANVAQLAQSLRAIIDKHRGQSNFQLVVITHDENFLKMINLSDYVDYYYRVQKNSEQFSTIKRLPVTES